MAARPSPRTPPATLPPATLPLAPEASQAVAASVIGWRVRRDESGGRIVPCPSSGSDLWPRDTTRAGIEALGEGTYYATGIRSGSRPALTVVVTVGTPSQRVAASRAVQPVTSVLDVFVDAELTPQIRMIDRFYQLALNSQRDADARAFAVVEAYAQRTERLAVTMLEAMGSLLGKDALDEAQRAMVFAARQSRAAGGQSDGSMEEAVGAAAQFLEKFPHLMPGAKATVAAGIPARPPAAPPEG